MSLCSGTAQFDLNTTLHQVLDEFLVRIARRNISVSVVRLVVQRHVAGICVEHRDDVRLRIPIGDVTLDELKVEDGSRQVSFERQGADAVHRPDVRHFDGDIDMKWLC